MEPFTKDEFLGLADIHDKHCISIYIQGNGMKEGIKEVEKDQLQLKNLLKEARRILHNNKLSAVEIDRILEPANPLLEDASLLRTLEKGMAVFISDGELRRYNSSVTFNSSLHVDDHFYLLPLVDLLNEDKDFFLLALSANQTKFFRGNIEGLVEIDTEDFIPSELVEVVGTDYRQKSLPYRRYKGEEGNRGMFHGHGAGGSIEKQKELALYFREINKGLNELIGKERGIPMILACVESHCSMFKEICEYKDVIDQSIAGNHESTHPQELHAQALKILRDLDKAKIVSEKERFMELLNKGRSSDKSKEIISAAYHGKIDVLFADKNGSLWGYYDPQADAVRFQDPQISHGSTDLLNFAAIQTIRNNGKVYLLSHAEMPEEGPLLAVYRYSS